MSVRLAAHEPLRIGLIGYGRIGRVHAANIASHPRAKFAGVHDALAAATAEAAARFGVTAYADAEALIGDDAIDAVVIASPTPTHVDYLQASVFAGKATLCEKPIDLDIAKVDACRAAIAAHDVPVMIGFQRRFDPSLRHIREAVRAGEIGAVESLRILSRDPVPPPLSYVAVSGGQPRDMSIHDIDLVRWIMPDEPVAVAAMGSILIQPRFAEHSDTDSLQIIIRTGAGRLAHIDNSRRTSYGYDQRLEVFGERGALEMTNPRLQNVERWDATGTGRRGQLSDGFIDRYAEAYAAEMDHFVTSVLDGTPPDVGFEDGRRALIMADAVLESLRTDRFVELDFGGA